MTSIFPPQVGKEKTEWFVVKEASTVNCQISQSDCATCNSVDGYKSVVPDSPFPLLVEGGLGEGGLGEGGLGTRLMHTSAGTVVVGGWEAIS